MSYPSVRILSAEDALCHAEWKSISLPTALKREFCRGVRWVPCSGICAKIIYFV